ncbi:unnamed protein product [Diabrotica balteata]|uniref:DNA-directed DNA polymerase n=1 Tax=Diabrotica balteata TaxID=107213 RepID=A0A9N9TDI0_DIABA|nr:unnamed protein product [Diabrotica balteata]
MKQYSIQERVDMILIIGECNENCFLTARAYAQKYPNRDRPDKRTLERILDRFRTTGSVAYSKQTPNKPVIDHEENEFNVLASIAEDANTSGRKISNQIDIPRTSDHDNDPNIKTHLSQKHEAFSIAYYFKSSYNSLSYYKSFTGHDCQVWFVRELEQIAKRITRENLFQKFKKLNPLTDKERHDFTCSFVCHICTKPIVDPLDKVRDHCHITGKFRGAAHRSCNNQNSHTIPIVFHNLSGYNAHFLIKSLNTHIKGNISLLPLNKERFMSDSLDKLSYNLDDDQKHITRQYFDNEFKFNLVKRKGVFPYEYLDNWEKLQDTCLPPIDSFFSTINNEGITHEEYKQACTVWNTFEIKTLKEYAELYLKSDVLLLSDIFENFRLMCLKTYGLDSLHYFTLPGLAFDAMLKVTNVELELLTDIEMILFFEKAKRGVSQCSNRYAEANNKYMVDTYNPNMDLNEYLIINVEAPEPECFKWNHTNTLHLINLYKKYRKLVGTSQVKSFKKLFEVIVSELRKVTEINIITAAHCENKWRVLERSYKKYVDHNNQTGRGRRDFEYANALEEILGKKKNIVPEILLNTETIDYHQVEPKPSCSRTAETSQSEMSSSQVKQTNKNKTLRASILKETRKDRQEYYKKKLNIEERMLEAKIEKWKEIVKAKNEKNQILREKNELLKILIDQNKSSNKGVGEEEHQTEEQDKTYENIEEVDAESVVNIPQPSTSGVCIEPAKFQKMNINQDRRRKTRAAEILGLALKLDENIPYGCTSESTTSVIISEGLEPTRSQSKNLSQDEHCVNLIHETTTLIHSVLLPDGSSYIPETNENITPPISTSQQVGSLALSDNQESNRSYQNVFSSNNLEDSHFQQLNEELHTENVITERASTPSTSSAHDFSPSESSYNPESDSSETESEDRVSEENSVPDSELVPRQVYFGEINEERKRKIKPDTATSSTELETTEHSPQHKGDSGDIWAFFDSKMEKVENSTSKTSSAFVTIKQYLQLPYLKRLDNPLEFWKKHKIIFPELYELALKYLCIPATSVPSERVF